MSVKDEVTKFFSKNPNATNQEAADAVGSTASGVAHIMADLRDPNRVIVPRGARGPNAPKNTRISPVEMLQARQDALKADIEAAKATIEAAKEELTRVKAALVALGV